MHGVCESIGCTTADAPAVGKSSNHSSPAGEMFKDASVENLTEAKLPLLSLQLR